MTTWLSETTPGRCRSTTWLRSEYQSSQVQVYSVSRLAGTGWCKRSQVWVWDIHHTPWKKSWRRARNI